MDKFDTKQAAQNLLRTLTGATGNTIGPIQYAIDAAYRAGLERAGEIATNHRAAVPPECVSEVEKYGREIADAIRKEAGNG